MTHTPATTLTQDETSGSLFDGVLVGLAIEAGFAAVAALLFNVIRPFGWSHSFDSTALMLVVLFSVLLVAKVCVGPLPDPITVVSGWFGRRRVAVAALRVKRSHLAG